MRSLRAVASIDRIYYVRLQPASWTRRRVGGDLSSACKL
jgi:hypothetical protein